MTTKTKKATTYRKRTNAELAISRRLGVLYSLELDKVKGSQNLLVQLFGIKGKAQDIVANAIRVTNTPTLKNDDVMSEAVEMLMITIAEQKPKDLVHMERLFARNCLTSIDTLLEQRGREWQRYQVKSDNTARSLFPENAVITKSSLGYKYRLNGDGEKVDRWVITGWFDSNTPDINQEHFPELGNYSDGSSFMDMPDISVSNLIHYLMENEEKYDDVASEYKLRMALLIGSLHSTYKNKKGDWVVRFKGFQKESKRTITAGSAYNTASVESVALRFGVDISEWQTKQVRREIEKTLEMAGLGKTAEPSNFTDWAKNPVVLSPTVSRGIDERPSNPITLEQADIALKGSSWRSLEYPAWRDIGKVGEPEYIGHSPCSCENSLNMGHGENCENRVSRRNRIETLEARYAS